MFVSLSNGFQVQLVKRQKEDKRISNNVFSLSLGFETTAENKNISKKNEVIICVSVQ